MTDDLVKRLRERDAAGGDYCTEWGEAADRIENLNYQIRIIQGAAAHAQKSYEQHLAVYHQKLDEKPPVWHDHIQSLQERDAIMTDRIEKLEAALREIIDIHPFKDPEGDASVKAVVDLMFHINLTARRALNTSAEHVKETGKD